MKTKAIIEWVSGESPETESIKLVTYLDKGNTRVTSTGVFRDGNWYLTGSDDPLYMDDAVALAWANLPVFDGPVEQAYTEGKTFCEALDAIKVGIRVRRHDWPLGSYLWLLPAASVKAEWCREPHLKQLAERNGGSVEALASIRLYQFGQVLTGWNPTSEDLFATNWMILD